MKTKSMTKKSSLVPLILLLGLLGGLALIEASKKPLNEKDIALRTQSAPMMEQLWHNPNPLPADVILKPETRVIGPGDEMCVMFTTKNSDQSDNADPVEVYFNVDFWPFAPSDYVPTARDAFYCIQPSTDRGYHLIRMRTLSGHDYEWAVRVE